MKKAVGVTVGGRWSMSGGDGVGDGGGAVEVQWGCGGGAVGLQWGCQSHY